MGISIAVRAIASGDKSWLGREARQGGVSLEKLGRLLIHEKRTESDCLSRRGGGHARAGQRAPQHWGRPLDPWPVPPR